MVNENDDPCSFTYDASDRLSEEVRIDNQTHRFSDDIAGHFTYLDEIGHDERGERPERHTLLERDKIGRLIAKLNGDAKQTCAYDAMGQLTLSDRRKVNHLYHGSGHLHQLNVDGHVVSDMEHVELHREVYRTHGKPNSCFGYDVRGDKPGKLLRRCLSTSSLRGMAPGFGQRCWSG